MNLDSIASRPVAIVNRGDTLNRAIQQMWRLGSEHLPVVERGCIVGIVSERDLLIHACGDKYAAQELVDTELQSVDGTTRVDAVMSSPVKTLSPLDPIEDGARLILRDKIHAIPLVNSRDPEFAIVNGIVTETDLLKCYRVDPPPFTNEAVPNMQVLHHMTSNVFSVSPHDLKPAAIRLMRDKRIHHVPVVDTGEQVLGVLSESDVLLGQKIDRPVAKLSLPISPPEEKVAVGDLMSDEPICVHLDSTLRDAAQIMVAHRFSCLPVVREARKMVGILTSTDLLRAFLHSHV